MNCFECRFLECVINLNLISQRFKTNKDDVNDFDNWSKTMKQSHHKIFANFGQM